ncbi:MAG: heat-inducible transcription repressor HrcA [Anaerolineae bacterium]|nr:heat-inducible transcription repressor HrcA [Anaerolineae bacterium]
MVMSENSEALTSRQAIVLSLIVREHVQTATPVASRTLVDAYQLECSPATVRNEMARLEELGYLYQPHTSAGRLPTEKGFRYFVERLMEQHILPQAEQRMIAHQFYQARNHIEEWMPLAAAVLSQSVQGASLVTPPRAEKVLYKHLELIATHGRAILLILVLQGGMVEQQMLALPKPMSQGELSEVADRLNQICTGLKAQEIASHLQELPPFEVEVANLIILIMQQMAQTPTDDIYRSGFSNLLMAPEFSEADSASAGVIRVLEEQSLLQTVLADTLGPSVGVGMVRVVIGGEGRWDDLRTCSMVLARYGVANYASGALGVVGPMRMAYARAISVVRFVADVLSELVYDMYLPGSRDTDVLLEL